MHIIIQHLFIVFYHNWLSSLRTQWNILKHLLFLDCTDFKNNIIMTIVYLLSNMEEFNRLSYSPLHTWQIWPNMICKLFDLWSSLKYLQVLSLGTVSIFCSNWSSRHEHLFYSQISNLEEFPYPPSDSINRLCHQ